MHVIKPFRAIAAALLTLTVLGGIETFGEEPEGPPKSKTFTSKDYGFQIDVSDFPASQPVKQVTVLQALADEPVGGFTPNVSVVVQMQKSTPEAYLEATKAELRPFGWTITEHKETKHAGKPALSMEYEGEMAGNELYWVALAVFDDERVFLVTGTMPLNGKDKVLEKVKKAVRSFSFLQ